MPNFISRLWNAGAQPPRQQDNPLIGPSDFDQHLQDIIAKQINLNFWVDTRNISLLSALGNTGGFIYFMNLLSQCHTYMMNHHEQQSCPEGMDSPTGLFSTGMATAISLGVFGFLTCKKVPGLFGQLQTDKETFKSEYDLPRL